MNNLDYATTIRAFGSGDFNKAFELMYNSNDNVAQSFYPRYSTWKKSLFLGGADQIPNLKGMIALAIDHIYDRFNLGGGKLSLDNIAICRSLLAAGRTKDAITLAYNETYDKNFLILLSMFQWGKRVGNDSYVDSSFFNKIVTQFLSELREWERPLLSASATEYEEKAQSIKKWTEELEERAYHYSRFGLINLNEHKLGIRGIKEWAENYAANCNIPGFDVERTRFNQLMADYNKMAGSFCKAVEQAQQILNKQANALIEELNYNFDRAKLAELARMAYIYNQDSRYIYANISVGKNDYQIFSELKNFFEEC